MDNARATRVSGGFDQAFTVLGDLSSLRRSVDALLHVIDLESQPIEEEVVTGEITCRVPLSEERAFATRRRLRRLPSERVAHDVVRLMQSTLGLLSYGHEPFDAAAQQHGPANDVFELGHLQAESALAVLYSTVVWSLQHFGSGTEPPPSQLCPGTVISEDYESTLAISLIDRKGDARMRDWVSHAPSIKQLVGLHIKLMREMRVAMAGTPLGYFGVTRPAAANASPQPVDDRAAAGRSHARPLGVHVKLDGWTKKELYTQADISSSSFNRIRKVAGVEGASQGEHGFRYGPAELRRLIGAAASRPELAIFKKAAINWSEYLGQGERGDLKS